MTSIKAKFRPSSGSKGDGVIYYQIIHNRVVRQMSTEYRIYSSEWDKERDQVTARYLNAERREYIKDIQMQINLDIDKFINISTSMNQQNTQLSINDLISVFEAELKEYTFLKFMQGVIKQLREIHKERCVETYTATLKSFMRFREGKDILLDDITSDLIIRYEAFLKHTNVTTNTISFYMRVLRAVYNRAVDRELICQRYPFKKVYTGVDKTLKRALPLKNIKQIKGLDLSQNPKMAFARDMFLFSFYTRGMSFVDMAYLRKKDLKNGILSYRRRKTGQQLHIKWEKCMEEIVSRYPTNPTDYLMPIITERAINERRYYQYQLSKINYQLRMLSSILSLQPSITMYVARHSWASIAKSRNIPISVISEGMGHNSEATTQIYLASLNTAVIDRANRAILKLLA